VTSELHPHQEQAIKLLRASLGSGHRRPLLQAPTGYGKTLVAAYITEQALAKGRRVLMVVPRMTLVDQTVELFAAEGVDAIGVMQGDHPMTDCSQPLQIASVQTLIRRAKPPADLVIVDECHEQYHRLTTWLASPEMANVPVIGLSATPWSRGLSRIYDDLIVGARTGELIAAGFLAGYRIFAPAHPDLTAVGTVKDDYHRGQLAKVMSKPALVADVVTTWRRLGENRTTLVFAVDRAHARLLEAQFECAGIATAYIDAFTKTPERKAIFAKFHDGAVRVIVSIGTLTMGVDLDVRCIVLARPTKSEMLFVQMIGRGLRVAEGKDHCLILDHSDTTLRLGFPDQIHHDALDDGTRRRTSPRRAAEERLPKECPKCSFVKSIGVHVCPNCDFAPERQSNVKTIDGELVELNAEKATALAEAEREKRQRWYSMFIWLREQWAYKPGWVAKQYQTKFKDWPRGLDETPLVADAEVRNWARHRQIRYAKAKAKRAAA
jgi:DNA repair protein RadD